MSSFIGALADAWAEIRVHKLRVLLSLIGIAVSVAALTAVIAFSELQQQYQAEQSDRSGGRAATLSVAQTMEDGLPVPAEEFDARFTAAAERFDFSHVARNLQGISLNVSLSDGIVAVPARVVDPNYSLIHRETLLVGRGFQAGDEQLLAPPVIISEPLWDRLGRADLATHPVLSVTGDAAGTYQVVGVSPRQGPWDDTLIVDLLYDSYVPRIDALPESAMMFYEVWVPPDQTNDIAPVLAMDLRSGLPAGQIISVTRTDWSAAAGAMEAMATFELITGGIAGLILALGALSLVNIQLVAMRQRVREIGVRRAFGATAGRVFTAVLFESLVATSVAGLVGVIAVVAVLRSDWVVPALFPGIQDVPAFPMRAAVTGLIASVLVGAVAGFVPALVALRVKVIDAIRF